MNAVRFPAGFQWGVATAAYQIEGAATEDGRGPSIWDVFSHTPGMTFQGATGDVACDHYHRWPEDVALLRALGVTAYRLSLAWPRVLPAGTGPLNARGLAFYERLVEALLAAGITPVVTLYHWDLPQALQDRGGWASRATAEAFAAYADVVARRLGDRVHHWITLNEPWVVTFAGHVHGGHPPDLRDPRLLQPVSHHLLLAHGQAAAALRAGCPAARVGIALNLAPAYPATDAPDDVAAAWRFDGHLNRWFLDPLFGRGYPTDMVDLYGGPPPVEQGDLEAIAAPLDFLGVNYYTPVVVRAATGGTDPLRLSTRSAAEAAAEGYEVTEMGWAVEPRGLDDLLRRLHADYAPPALYITENGAAFPDQLADGKVDDPRRVVYLHDHLAAAGRALAAGVPLRGYFVWSLLDNLEWGYGFSKRFGLVYVDFATQQRIPKASFAWYQRVIAANAVAGVE